MIHLNISGLEYEAAIWHLMENTPNIYHVDCHIDFWADHSQSKVLRDFIGKIFDAHNIHAPWRGRFILITDELVNNAIEHGSRYGDLDACVIIASRDAAGTFRIILEVHDTGTGKDSTGLDGLLKIKKHKEEVEHDDVYMEKRGRGLFHITEKLVDKLEFSESPKGGLAVKIEKNISYEEAHDLEVAATNSSR